MTPRSRVRRPVWLAVTVAAGVVVLSGCSATPASTAASDAEVQRFVLTIDDWPADAPAVPATASSHYCNRDARQAAALDAVRAAGTYNRTFPIGLVGLTADQQRRFIDLAVDGLYSGQAAIQKRQLYTEIVADTGPDADTLGAGSSAFTCLASAVGLDATITVRGRDTGWVVFRERNDDGSWRYYSPSGDTIVNATVDAGGKISAIDWTYAPGSEP